MLQPIVLDYVARPQFIPFHKRQQRFACIVAHRRAGKTVACAMDMIDHALRLKTPHGRYAYVAPFLAQAKETIWEYLKRYARPVTTKTNESELWIELLNGARIRVHGADNPDRLRGSYLDGVVLDEYADMRPSVWGEVIGPMLADRRGWATFIGTPKGRNEFFKIYDAALKEPGWYTCMLKASETHIISDDELAVWREQMTPEQYEQEFETSFEAAILGAYFGKEMAIAAAQGRILDLPIDPDKPVNTAWDLGNGDHMAIWCWQYGAPGEIRVVDFLQFYGYSMEKYCLELDNRGYHGVDHVPHDARTKSLETGKSRIETLIKLKRRPEVVPDHHVEDGINAARMEFRRFWFDERKCKDGLEALRQYRAEFDEKLNTFRDVPRKDWATHAADAFRYLCVAWRGLRPPEPVKPQEPMRGIGSISVDEFIKMAAPPRVRV